MRTEHEPFLTGSWTNLIMVNYAVPPSLVEPLLPPGCMLETVGADAFVSLVAFAFENTKVFGIRWPFYSDFPELNLRFYVRHGECRGLVFVRELVQSRVVALIARTIYNEPFRCVPMVRRVVYGSDTIDVRHGFSLNGGEYGINIVADRESCSQATESANFFKEHYWAFGTSRSGRLLRHCVEHPVWNVHPVQSFELSWDWGKIYGPSWVVLQNQKPHSVFLADGSAVRLYPKEEVVRG